jgi:hypothetical protein
MLAPALALSLQLGACAPDGHPRLAEVLYDPSGDDTGAEFVELWNPYDVTLALNGLRLEAADGATSRWTLRWTGGPADSVRAHGRFVIGGARVTPAPDAIVTLSLQNGPDAVRVSWPDGAAEVLGYGALADSALFCGAPAVDAASGLALARIPDAANFGSNALDFRAATPTPGRANLPARDLAVLAGSLALTPPQPRAGAPSTLSLAIVNRGSVALSLTEVRIEIAQRLESEALPVATAFAPRDLPAGDTLAIDAALPALNEGKCWLTARAGLVGDESDANDADSLRVRVGDGPVAVTEIQFHPASGEGEWVEIQGRADPPVEIATLRLSDRTGTTGTPADGAHSLAHGSLAVLTQDRAGFIARFPDLDSTRVVAVSPWPSLNNSDDAAGVADEVVLREDDGTPVDRIGYSARGVPAGVPIERSPEGVWHASGNPAGTPLEPPRVLPPLSARLRLAQPRITSDRRVAIEWSLPWPRATGAVTLYDLAGRKVATVLPETEISGRGELRWDTRALPGGLYLVTLLARDVESGATLTASTPMRVEGGAR